MIKKKLAVFQSYLQFLPADKRLRELKPLLPTLAQQHNSELKVVLVEAVADPYYLALFSALIHAISGSNNIRPYLFVSRSVESQIGRGFKGALKRSFPYIWLTFRQWVRMYDGIAIGVGYRSVSWGHPFDDLFAFISAHKTWKALLNLSNLEQIYISDIKCGDLIIDTYLRFRPAATVHLKDPFLRYLIWQAYRDVHRAKRYFSFKRPELFLSSYSTYIQHGIAVRVALLSGIKVVTFGNLQQVGKVLSPEDYFHTKNPENYRKNFILRNDQELLLKTAQMQLETRLSGGVDDATSYMAISAYSKGNAECPNVRGAVIIYLHDFFDSPHIYPELIFPDFWSWICFTVETLSTAKIPFFLKRHPNQVGLSEGVVEQLIKKYPQLLFVPDGVTTSKLVAEGIASVVTVYGTIAHEAAYFGVPSISCARHPHVAFDFCKTAKTVDEYDALLKKSNLLCLKNKEIAKQQALEFYAMHNLDLSSDQMNTKKLLRDLWKITHSRESRGKEIAVAAYSLAEDPGFLEFSRTLLK